MKIKTVRIWDCKVCGKVKASKAVFERRRRLVTGGETPPPSPERQATIEAPFEDIFTCFLSCSASMVSSLWWLHSRF